MNLWVIFLTGLTVGGLTCLAVQGGLLASVITSREEEEIKKGVNRKKPLYPTLAFLLAKLIAYTVLGFFLGAFGGAIGINQSVQIIMQFIAGMYMIAVALNLLQIHPIFRYVIIQPPRFLTRLVRNQSKSRELFAPAFLGAMTIFIPCGTTVAIEALAISSANPFVGAAIMAVFILGTTPVFFGVGWLTSVLGDAYRTKFLRIAAVAVLYLGITSVNGALVAIDSPLSFQAITENIPRIISSESTSAKQSDGVVTQNPEILITTYGYAPNYIRVKKGSLVTLKLTNKDAYSCAAAFRIPSLGVAINLQPNSSEIITFTPTKEGTIPFSCSMGMYRGVIEVI